MADTRPHDHEPRRIGPSVVRGRERNIEYNVDLGTNSDKNSPIHSASLERSRLLFLSVGKEAV